MKFEGVESIAKSSPAERLQAIEGGTSVEKHSPEEGLHICPGCTSEFCQPVEWHPSGTRRWWVDRECVECGWHEAGEFSQREADRYDEVLDAHTESVLDDLCLLSMANSQEAAERFIEALHAGHIQPIDF